jgi:hypothetical protein
VLYASDNREAQMVSVQARFNGEGIWRQLTLPLTMQLAQTVASAAKVLNLGDQVKVIPSSEVGRRLDIRA